jgi:hypothetical protein
VLVAGGDAVPERVGAADLLKTGWGGRGNPVEVVAAVAADDLKRAGVAAFGLAVDGAGRLALLRSLRQ